MDQQLIGILAVGLWLALLVISALVVRRRWPQRREWSRKVLHIGTGAVVPIAWWSGVDRGVALAAAAAITVLAGLNHRYRLVPAIEDVGRHSYGTIAYGAAITTLLALFWPERPAAVTAGVLVLALGDGAAGLLGPLWSSPHWQWWGHRKSVLGTAAMAAVSLVALLLLRSLVLQLGLPAPGLASLAAMVVVAVGLEQIALLGLDNLTVPIAVGLLWHLCSLQP